jgi:isopentenyl-diphosphate delta-isomerase
MTRERTLVELVDADGAPAGAATVAEAHTEPGRLHRAFSVLLVDPTGRLLLQQRAAGKTRFALRWANACCGHPAPGEPVVEAAARRVAEELGLRTVELTPVGVYLYRAADPVSRLVEHEYDHVLVGRVPAEPAVAPDPAEVAALRWADPVRLRAELTAAPWLYAPWLEGVVSVWEPAGVEPSGGR